MENRMDFGTEGIVEDDGVGQTCQRSISDRYITKILKAMNNSSNIMLELP